MATINRGDKVEINGETWYYYGTSEGNNFYTKNPSSSESNCQIYYVSDEGTVEKVYVATAQGDVDEKDLGQNGNNTAKVPNTDVTFKWKDLKDSTSTTVDYQQKDGVYVYGTSESAEDPTKTASTPGVGDYLTKVEGVDSQKRNVQLPGRSGTEVMTYYGSKDGYDYYGDSLQNVYRIPSGGGSWEDCGYKKSYLESGGNPVVEEPPAEQETETDPYASFDYTMACNADEIKTKLSTIMDKTAKDIEEIIDDIYTKIHGMPSAGAWDGESYNAFKDSVDGYKKNLDELVVIMKGFKIVFDTASEDAKQLGADIDTQLSNFS